LEAAKQNTFIGKAIEIQTLLLPSLLPFFVASFHFSACWLMIATTKIKE
jgi:hypothetical protein